MKMKIIKYEGMGEKGNVSFRIEGNSLIIEGFKSLFIRVEKKSITNFMVKKTAVGLGPMKIKFNVGSVMHSLQGPPQYMKAIVEWMKN